MAANLNSYEIYATCFNFTEALLIAADCNNSAIK